MFYLLPPSPGVDLPDRYYSEFRGLVARQDFRVVKACELEARDVVKRGPLALVPLTPLMRGADEDVVRAGARVLREQGADEEMEVAVGSCFFVLARIRGGGAWTTKSDSCSTQRRN